MAVQDARVTEGHLTTGRTSARSPARSAVQQRFGSVWTRSLQDVAPLISLNAAAAPEWSAALDIDRQLAAGNPLPGATHSPFKISGAEEQLAVQDDRHLYQPPVELVVLHSQLHRLGPSTPFRYTAVSAPTVSPKHLQQPLLSPVKSPAGCSMKWAADAGTQTIPDWLATDAQRMGEGQLVSRPRSASPRAVRQPNTQTMYVRPGTASRLHGSKYSSTSSPWRLVGKHTAAGGGEPWLPPGFSDGGVADLVEASTAAAWAAKGAAVNDGAGSHATQAIVGRYTAPKSEREAYGNDCGDWRAYSPTSRRRAAQQARERARQQLEASAKYAAIGRAAARETAAAAAAASQSQQQQSLGPAGSRPGRLTVAQQHRSAVTKPAAVSRRFKTVPPPTQPWKPAGAAPGAGQLQHAVQDSGTARSAKAAPSSLRILINRTKQRLSSAPSQPGGAAVLGASAAKGLSEDEWLSSDNSSIQSMEDLIQAVMREQLGPAAAMDSPHDLLAADALVPRQDFARLQALLDETSSQEAVGSEQSWQLPAGQHAVSSAAQPPAVHVYQADLQPDGSNLSITSSAAIPLQQHEDGLSAAATLDSPRPLTADHLSCSTQLGNDAARSAVKGQRISHLVSRRPGSPGVRYDHIDLHSPTRRAATAGQVQPAAHTAGAGHAAAEMDGNGFSEEDSLLDDLAVAYREYTTVAPVSVGHLEADATTQHVEVPHAAAAGNSSQRLGTTGLEAQLLAALGPELAARVLDRPGLAQLAGSAAASAAQHAMMTLQQTNCHMHSADMTEDTAAAASRWLSEGHAAEAVPPSSISNTADGSTQAHRGLVLEQLIAQHSSSSSGSDGDGDSQPSAAGADLSQDVASQQLPQVCEQCQALEEPLTQGMTAAAAACPEDLVAPEQHLMPSDSQVKQPIAASEGEFSSVHAITGLGSRHDSVGLDESGYLVPSSYDSSSSITVEGDNSQHYAKGQADIDALQSILQVELNDLDLEFANLEERLMRVATSTEQVAAELPIPDRQSSTPKSLSDASQPLHNQTSDLVDGELQQSVTDTSMLPLRYHWDEAVYANGVRSHSVRFSSMADSNVDDSIADDSDSDAVNI